MDSLCLQDVPGTGHFDVKDFSFFQQFSVFSALTVYSHCTGIYLTHEMFVHVLYCFFIALTVL